MQKVVKKAERPERLNVFRSTPFEYIVTARPLQETKKAGTVVVTSGRTVNSTKQR